MATKNKQKGSEKLKDPQQELFCYIYAGVSTRDYFGNATRCYLHAYGYEEELAEIEIELGKLKSNKRDNMEYQRLNARKKSVEMTAKTNGTRLLSKAHIRDRVDFFTNKWLEDVHADREMGYVIAQRYDLASKVMAFKEVAKMKGRMEVRKLPEKIKVSWEDGPEEAPKGTKKAAPKAKKLAGSVEIQFEGDEE